MTNPRLVVITGPTASGKSALAMEIAQQHKGEIICADSRTVYKGMDIGTGKPSAHDRAIVPHHLLDVVEPNQSFTAAQFKKLANEAIQAITARGALPILVGGTGLYIDAVIFDYQFGQLADMAQRAVLMSKTITELQNICNENNIPLPINNKNKRHLVRAIELNGLPQAKRELRDNTLVVSITMEIDVLEQRIRKRTLQMFNAGVIKEAQSLGQKYGWDTEAMTANIYRFCHEILQGSMSQAEAIERIIKSDKSLAKRQRTWLKRNPYIVWGSADELRQHINAFLM